VMLTTYDRIMRQKRMEARLQRDEPCDEREVIPSAIVALVIKRAVERGR
jgi:hypothetical protein